MTRENIKLYLFLMNLPNKTSFYCISTFTLLHLLHNFGVLITCIFNSSYLSLWNHKLDKNLKYWICQLTRMICIQPTVYIYFYIYCYEMTLNMRSSELCSSIFTGDLISELSLLIIVPACWLIRVLDWMITIQQRSGLFVDGTSFYCARTFCPDYRKENNTSVRLNVRERQTWPLKQTAYSLRYEQRNHTHSQPVR